MATDPLPSRPVGDDMRTDPFWVLERSNKGQPEYWDGGHADSATSDINRAVQFCRRDDALRGWRMGGRGSTGKWELVEHAYMFPSRPAGGSEAMSGSTLLPEYDETIESLAEHRRAEVAPREEVESLKILGGWRLSIEPQTPRVPQLKAEVQRLREALQDARSHLAVWWREEHRCPCGARPESPQTHPHVITCPTAAALTAGQEPSET